MPSPDALTLSQTRAALAHAGGKKKLELLLEGPDPRALVQSIPAHELYLTLLDIGLDDTAEVVALASPAQFRHFIDASAWPKRDAPPDPRKIMRWLTLARDGGDQTDQAMRRFHLKLAGLDPELFSLLLRRELKVHDLTENEFPELSDDAQTWHSPDRKYMVEFLEEGSPYAIIKRLLDDLATQNPFHLSRMLEALRWEVPSELEETSRRWRDGRMRDAGVPDIEEALAFVARPRTGRAEAAGGKSAGRGAGEAGTATDPVTIKNTNVALQVNQLPAPMLDRIAAKIPGEDRAQVEESVAYAANAALVAWQVQLDDPAELRPALENARNLISLGLDVLASGDEALAAQIVVERPIRSIFQAAMGELYRLQSRARAAAKAARLPEAQSATLFDSPQANLIAALDANPPLVERLLPASPGSAAPPHAPASLDEVRLADALLDEAATLPRLFSALGLELPRLGLLAAEAGIAPSALRASDALRALISTELAGAPLSLTGAHDRDAAAREGFARQLDDKLSAAVARLDAGERAPATRLAERLRAAIFGRP